MTTAADRTVLEIKDLCKSFGSNHVLRNFTVTLSKGENLAVLGKSGSGKSVLIKCIIGLIRPDSGSIKVFGQEVHQLDQEDLDQMRARIGFLFQSNALYDSMTVEENLLFPLRRHWITHEHANPDEAVIEALSDVGLLHTRMMMPSELSGGMRKRIALARTLILKPEIILYDEPTTGLDPITSREISGLIVKVQKKYNTASMIISHDMNCIHAVANRIVMLIDGRCYANDTYGTLLQATDEKIREFFIESV